MDPTLISVICFVVATIMYYIFKPSPTYLISNNDAEGEKEYGSAKLMYLVIYILVILITQFAVNASVIATNCGGSISDNIGVGAFITFIPWVVIFGSMTMMLMIFPGFKSAFSNVVGYFAVAAKANDILSKLLVNRDLERQMENANMSVEEKHSMERAADSIVKLAGNKAVLINQIVPENFTQYWTILQPLMKREFFSSRATELMTMKESFFGLVVLRDNIGEALWYFYTAILLIFIVNYYIATKGCIKNPSAMLESAAQYQADAQAAADEQAKLDSQIYVG